MFYSYEDRTSGDGWKYNGPVVEGCIRQKMVDNVTIVEQFTGSSWEEVYRG